MEVGKSFFCDLEYLYLLSYDQMVLNPLNLHMV